jgi:hypothetical protein
MNVRYDKTRQDHSNATTASTNVTNAKVENPNVEKSTVATDAETKPKSTDASSSSPSSVRKSWKEGEANRAAPKVVAAAALTASQQLAQADALFDSLRRAVLAGALEPERLLEKVRAVVNGVPSDQSAVVLSEAALFATQTLYRNGKLDAGDALVRDVLTTLDPLVANPSIDVQAKLNLCSLKGLAAQRATRLDYEHEQLTAIAEGGSAGAPGPSLNQTLQLGEERLKTVFDDVNDALRKTSFALSDAAARTPIDSPERNALLDRGRFVDRYQQDLRAARHEALAALYAHAGRTDAQMAALEKELGARLGLAPSMLLAPGESKELTSNGEDAAWHDLFGTTKLGAMTPSQLDQFKKAFDAKTFDGTKRSHALHDVEAAEAFDAEQRAKVLDAVVRYTQAAQKSGNPDAINVGRQLLDHLGDDSNAPGVVSESQLAAANLQVGRGDVYGALVAYHTVEKRLAESQGGTNEVNATNATNGVNEQLDRAVMAQASILESLAAHGPEDTRLKNAEALRSMREKYEAQGRASKLSFSSLVELSFAEARAFVNVDPNESVATLEHLKKTYAENDSLGRKAMPQWLWQRLEQFDGRYKDDGGVAAAQSLLAEFTESSWKEDVAVGAAGFVGGAALGVPAGTLTGASVGAEPGAVAGDSRADSPARVWPSPRTTPTRLSPEWAASWAPRLPATTASRSGTRFGTLVQPCSSLLAPRPAPSCRRLSTPPRPSRGTCAWSWPNAVCPSTRRFDSMCSEPPSPRPLERSPTSAARFSRRSFLRAPRFRRSSRTSRTFGILEKSPPTPPTRSRRSCKPSSSRTPRWGACD